MSSTTNYCLKGPQDQVVGFRLGAEELGHEIYDILDWADAHFSSYFVEQTNGRVYVCSEAVRDALGTEEIRAEPLSIESGGPGDPPGGSPGGGGSAGGGSAGSDPVTSNDGGGATAETAGR